MAIKTVAKKKAVLTKKAEENTTVKVKVGKEPEEIIKEGNPLDHARKQNQVSSPNEVPQTIVGLSKGVTVNMGDYQSLRVDCWLTTPLKEGQTLQQAYDEIAELIEERISIEVERATN